ncbi:MAG: hypothetical protein ACM3Q1_07895 [Bacteroidales bacterium]
MLSRLPLPCHDALERRYDGPIPPADPALPRHDGAGRARLFQRLARETRERAAARRHRLPAAAAQADALLAQMIRDLGSYRTHGLAWLRDGTP